MIDNYLKKKNLKINLSFVRKEYPKDMELKN